MRGFGGPATWMTLASGVRRRLARPADLTMGRERVHHRLAGAAVERDPERLHDVEVQTRAHLSRVRVLEEHENGAGMRLDPPLGLRGQPMAGQGRRSFPLRGPCPCTPSCPLCGTDQTDVAATNERGEERHVHPDGDHQ